MRDEFGVWSLIIPAVDGLPKIKHLQKYKVQIEYPDG
jgi:hypothetical protein